jgi:hypothetical protein
MTKRHIIFRAYIAMARAERFEPVEWTDADAVRDIETGETRYSELVWDENVRVASEIEKRRGLTSDEQFKLGLVATPTKLQNLFICDKLVKRFGVAEVTAIDQFDGKGVLRTSGDVMFPERTNGLIDRLRFFTLRQITARAKETV